MRETLDPTHSDIYSEIYKFKHSNTNIQTYFLPDGEDYVIMDHFIESFNVRNIMKGKRVKLRPD